MSSTAIPSDLDLSNLVREGQAEIFSPSSVFYNPVQEFNRDLTIAVITQYSKDVFSQRNHTGTYGGGHKEKQEVGADLEEKMEVGGGSEEKLTVDSQELHPGEEGSGEPVVGVKYENGIEILEALAASGLRSIRFAREIPGIKQVTVNDLNSTAVRYIEKNIVHNNVTGLAAASESDAILLMYKERRRYDVIDLDPYGSAGQFIDSAVQAVKDGGVLAVTATDMAVLCGNTPESTLAKYGSVAVKSPACHELALRILLQALDSAATRYGRYIEPVLSVSVDFYVRVFVRVHTGAAQAKLSATKSAWLVQCVECKSHLLHPRVNKVDTDKGVRFVPASVPNDVTRCPQCGGRQVMGGPYWCHPLHDAAFVSRLLESVNRSRSKFGTRPRLEGVLSTALDELPHVPLYYIFDKMAKTLHCTTPPLSKFRSAILNAGYQVSFAHAAKNSLKTDAPVSVLWDIFRCWIADSPVHDKWKTPGSTCEALLSRASQLTADFTPHPHAATHTPGLIRWQANPQPDWGPKPRASLAGRSLNERRHRGITKAEARKRKHQEANGSGVALKKSGDEQSKDGRGTGDTERGCQTTNIE